MKLRPLRFVITILDTGRFKADGLDADVEVTADDLPELRAKLFERLKPLGYTPKLLPLRSDAEAPTD